MVEIAKANKIKVILSSVLPTTSFNWNDHVENISQKIDSLNRRIESYAKQQRIPYADYYSEMVNDNDKNMKSSYTFDGVHPTKDGYLVMDRIIQEKIKKLK